MIKSVADKLCQQTNPLSSTESNFINDRECRRDHGQKLKL